MRIHLRRILGFAVLIIFAAVVMLMSPSRATDKEPSSAMMAVLQTDLKGFNTNNFDLSNSQYVSDVVIIDETPPYRWEGPAANAKWWADFRKLAKTINLTSYHLSFKKPKQWEISNDRAYIVLPTTFTGVAGGKPFTETGVETYLLVRTGSAWKTQGWAYGRLSTH